MLSGRELLEGVCSSRSRAAFRSASTLQIRQRLAQQRPRKRGRERLQIGVVELSEVVIAQVHGSGVAALARARLGDCAIFWHGRRVGP